MESFVPKQTKRDGPEAKIQIAFIEFLEKRDWLVKSTHGNTYQFGFPDLYAAHKTYGVRWIEIKNPLQYAFTRAQLVFFPKLTAVGVGIWVITAATLDEYKKLFQPANWHHYLSSYKHGFS